MTSTGIHISASGDAMFDTVPQSWVAEFASALRATSVREHDDHAEAQGSESFAHYVSSNEQSALLLLVGPFSTEREAALWVDTVQDVLLDRGRVEAALAVRVTRLVNDSQTGRRGDFNKLLGVRAS